MTYKHCSTVRDLFLFLFLDYRGFIEESLEFLSFNRIFHTVLDEQSQVAVFFNHTPQLLFADSKIDGCLGYGQGILLTNSHFVFFQSLSSFLVPYLKSQFRISRPRENPIFIFQGAVGAASASTATIVEMPSAWLG